MPRIVEMKEIDGRLAVFLDMPPTDRSPVTLWTEAERDAERVAALRGLMKLSHEEYTAMLLAAGEIPLERENGGLEYPPFKVFNAMLRAYANANDINL